ncbi:hypothetical protein [Xenorhabdus bovienii]|uniref:hypothetical protein n=1 Tax=Xenorhabdus bovienii TaxID=40576 RepID=UPI0023B2B695|nr:hypothetical protein [Xenorhabdus bovienii]MDE9455536.1 hypothetical protein [Xenorhabdus bovienii]MDE9539672.1 hypothetical protein [Xenorhabdus bovienii]MDE9551873.1 hypothetical protein [Xenorhabdus bovienii]
MLFFKQGKHIKFATYKQPIKTLSIQQENTTLPYILTTGDANGGNGSQEVTVVMAITLLVGKEVMVVTMEVEMVKHK